MYFNMGANEPGTDTYWKAHAIISEVRLFNALSMLSGFTSTYNGKGRPIQIFWKNRTIYIIPVKGTIRKGPENIYRVLENDTTIFDAGINLHNGGIDINVFHNGPWVDEAIQDAKNKEKTLFENSFSGLNL